MVQIFLLLWKDIKVVFRRPCFCCCELITPIVALWFAAVLSYYFIKISETSEDMKYKVDPEPLWEYDFSNGSNLVNIGIYAHDNRSLKMAKVLTQWSQQTKYNCVVVSDLSELKDGLFKNMEKPNKDKSKSEESNEDISGSEKTNKDQNKYAVKPVYDYAIELKKAHRKTKELEYSILVKELETHLFHYELELDQVSDGDAVIRDLGPLVRKIDDLFMEALRIKPISSLLIRLEFPEVFLKPSVGVLFQILPALLLTIYISTAVKFAIEKEEIMEYLALVGLTTTSFCLSHFLFSLLKFMLVFILGLVPVMIAMNKILSFPIFAILALISGINSILIATMIGMLVPDAKLTTKCSLIIFVIFLAHVFSLGSVIDNRWISYAHSLLNPFVPPILGGLAAGREAMFGNSVTFSNMTANMAVEFTVADSLIAVFLQFLIAVLLYVLLAWATNLKLGLGEAILRRCCKKKPKFKSDLQDITGAHEQIEHEGDVDIQLNDVTKIYDTGEKAVDQLSFDARRGEVTVLLGHNGAGKSTTFGMICGLHRPTKGTITVLGEQTKKRKGVGYCPQYNPIIRFLTVMEHLKLVCALKGGKSSQETEIEGIKLLQIMGIGELSKQKAMKLSGGQKRKLSLAMAMIGGSTVVLLDEPTAGMDPESRVKVAQLLREEKKNRTILLTTHYMDEAESVADQVLIMARGKLVASGSIPFLKSNFGSGYNLCIVREDSQKDEEIQKICEGSVPGAKFVGTSHGNQLDMVLPQQEVKRFPELFKNLEDNREALSVLHFGLSLDTLEKIFLRVGDLAEPDHEDRDQKAYELNKSFIESQFNDRHTGCSKHIRQVGIIIMKRYHLLFKNFSQIFVQIILPYIYFLYVAFSIDIINVSLSSDSLSNARLFFFGEAEGNKSATVWSNLRSAVKSLSGQGVTSVDIDDFKSLSFDRSAEEKLFGGFSYDPTFDYPIDGNETVSLNDAILVHFTPMWPMLALTLQNMLSNAQGVNIKVNIEQLNEYAVVKNESNPVIPLVMMLGLCLVISNFVIIYIEERVSKFAHQQRLTGVSTVLYWFSSFLADTILFTVILLAYLGVVIATGHEGWPGILAISFSTYLAMMPFVYITSTVINNPSRGNLLVIIYQLLCPIGAFFLVIGAAFVCPEEIGYVMVALNLILPPFGFMVGVTAQKAADFSLDANEGIGGLLLGHVAYALLMSFLFMFIQIRSMRRCCSRGSLLPGSNQKKDSEVEKMEHAILMGERDEDILVAKELTKCFKKMNRPAVDKVSMTVEKRECFGLLGVSGAGKTTVFDMLTGQTFPTRGTATIDNDDVAKEIAVGYCPQFDAILPAFTGRQTLTILAKLHGFIDVTEKVNLVLEAVGMEAHADKIVKNYSGGQRRKISVAAALLAPTKLVILDEPTAGIDPHARREIWSVLSALRDHSETSLLLTSHSMDECEALCSRIGILKEGQMIALGTSQLLKSKYGAGFDLAMTARDPKHREQILEYMANNMPDAKQHGAKSSSLVLKWKIPKTEESTWSSLFSQVINVAEQLSVRDFTLQQSSLEDAFIELATNPNAIKDKSGSTKKTSQKSSSQTSVKTVTTADQTTGTTQTSTGSQINAI